MVGPRSSRQVCERRAHTGEITARPTGIDGNCTEVVEGPRPEVVDHKECILTERGKKGEIRLYGQMITELLVDIYLDVTVRLTRLDEEKSIERTRQGGQELHVLIS